MTTQGSSVTAAMAAGSCQRFHLGQDPRLSSRLTERPTPACVSLGKGSVVYDSSFDLFKEIGHLCRLCKAIAGNSELVKPGGAQCLPSGVSGGPVPQREEGPGAPGSKGGQPRGHSCLADGYLQTHICSSVHTWAGNTRTFACLQEESGLVRKCALAQRYLCIRTWAVCVGTPAGAASPKLGAGAGPQVTWVMSCQGSP